MDVFHVFLNCANATRLRYNIILSVNFSKPECYSEHCSVFTYASLKWETKIDERGNEIFFNQLNRPWKSYTYGPLSYGLFVKIEI